MKKHTALRLLACLAATAVATSAVSLAAQAPTDRAATPAAVQQEAADTLADLLPRGDSADKEETVYIFADATGAAGEVLVGTWLKNPDGAATLADRTTLRDLENLKGTQAPAPAADGSCTWQADGQDVYYQGHSDAQLPVTVTVRYLLDGKETAPEKLAGASGHLSIQYSYQNHDVHEVALEGGKAKLYTPYLALDLLLLDNANFRNITIDNGKLLNDGDHTVVLGIALPGLQESLDIDEGDLSLPGSVTVEADVTDLSLPTGYTLVTGVRLGGDGQETDDMLNDAEDLVGRLQEAMDALTDGGSQLYDGLNTLLDSVGTLQNGVNALADGGSQLAAGAASLQGGLGQLAGNNDTLNAGARQIFQGVCATAQQQLNAQLPALGIDPVTLTPENYTQVLESLLTAVGGYAHEQGRLLVTQKVTEAVSAEVAAQVEAGARQQVEAQVRPLVEAGVRQTAEAQLDAMGDALYTQYLATSEMANDIYTGAALQVLVPQVAAEKGCTAEEATAFLTGDPAGQQMLAAAVAGMDEGSRNAALTAAAATLSAEQKAAIRTGALEQALASDEVKAQTEALVQQNVEEQMRSDEVQARMAAEREKQLASEAVQAIIADNISQQLASAEVQASIDAGLKENPAYQSLLSLRASLDGIQTFCAGLRSYTDGVSQAYAGSGTLVNGANQLSGGLDQLRSQCPALVDGVLQLRDGAGQLSDGLDQLAEEGVDRLIEAVDGDLSGLRQRLQALADLADDAQSFGGLAEGASGSVKYIWKLDGVEAA